MIDETGNVYGRLTVVGTNGNLTKAGRLMWVCKCSCGAEKEIEGRAMRRGRIKSCGCLKREMTRKRYHQASSRFWIPSALDDVDEDIVG
jgi:hypothetical protein